MNMYDDDERVKKHTLQSLFYLYANHVVIPIDFDNTIYETILLSQIDFWLTQAGLLRVVFSPTETGLAYIKFKKWRLDYEEFLDFLDTICATKLIKIDEIKARLLEAGVPGGNENTAAVVK